MVYVKMRKAKFWEGPLQHGDYGIDVNRVVDYGEVAVLLPIVVIKDAETTPPACFLSLHSDVKLMVMGTVDEVVEQAGA